MQRLLLWILLVAGKCCCQSAQRPAPRIVTLDGDYMFQTLFVIWECGLLPSERLFEVEVFHTELMVSVYHHTVVVEPNPLDMVYQWSWFSDMPLECTSHSVRVRSRQGESASEWSHLVTLAGKDTVDNRVTQVLPQDRVVPVGSNTTFCCIVAEGRKFGGMRASHSNLHSERLSERSYASVRTNQSPSKPSGTNVICNYDDGKLASGSVVFVGYPPAPQDLVCETRDLVFVECHWSPGRATHLFGPRRTFFFLNKRRCTSANSIKAAEYKCRVKMTLGQGETNWTLTAQNPLGRAELTDTADLSHRVRPLAPNVSVTSVGTQNVSLQWWWETPWYQTLPLVCQVRLTCDDQPRTQHFTGPGLDRALLTALQPASRYTTRVRCAAQQNFWKWGEWSLELNVTTEEDIPGPVDMWVQMKSDLEGCVVWKPLSKHQSHGKIQNYQVNLTGPSQSVQSRTVSSAGPYSTPFRLEDSGSIHVVTVMAQNSVGLSPPASITLPNFLAGDDDGSLEVVSSDDVLHVSWTPSSNATCGYVVTWFSNDSEHSCDLDWVKLPSTNNSTSIQLGGSAAGVRYILSVYDCTEGVLHLRGRKKAYVEELVPSGIVTALSVDQQGTDAVLRWGEVPLEECRGFIRGYLVYSYNITHFELLGNISDPLARSYTVKQLSFDTHKFMVKAYTSAGAGRGANVSIRLEPYTDFLIIEILIAVGANIVLLILLTTVCYTKREWVKKTFYPEIPEPKLMEWSPAQGFGCQTLDVSPCAHSAVQIVDDTSAVSGKEELKLVLENPDNELEDELVDMDTDEQTSLRYYNQVVGEDSVSVPRSAESSGSSSSFAGSMRTEVTYTGIQTSASSLSSSCSSLGAPTVLEAPVSVGYRPQMDPVQAQTEALAGPSDVPLLVASMGYQPQCSWRLDSPEETSLDSSLGSPTSVSSSQFLLPDSSVEEGGGHALHTTWFRSLLSGKP